MSNNNLNTTNTNTTTSNNNNMPNTTVDVDNIIKRLLDGNNEGEIEPSCYNNV